jgi:hypothetical protein
LIAYGAFLTSFGWFLLAKNKEANKWLKKYIGFMPDIVRDVIIAIILCFLFIAGPHAIGKGGKLTTEGWNLLENHKQKRALIVALAREWILNESCTLLPPMSFDANDPNLGKEHMMYPQFRTSAQDRILTSALFDLTNQLLLTVVVYEYHITNFNTLLAWTNEYCLKLPENIKQQERKVVYIGIRDRSPLNMHFKDSHKELLKLLKKEYSWALDEAKQTVDPNLLLSEIKE